MTDEVKHNMQRQEYVARINRVIDYIENNLDGEIGKMTLSGGQFAIGHFELKSDEYEAAWDTLMGGWLPDSGYQPDDRLCYELFHTSPKDDPEGRSKVDICIPVKPL